MNIFPTCKLRLNLNPLEKFMQATLLRDLGAGVPRLLSIINIIILLSPVVRWYFHQSVLSNGTSAHWTTCILLSSTHNTITQAVRLDLWQGRDPTTMGPAALHWCRLIDWLRLNVLPNTLQVTSGMGFYGSNDPTNSVNTLKEHTKLN